jgi:hypothetical protein
MDPLVGSVGSFVSAIASSVALPHGPIAFIRLIVAAAWPWWRQRRTGSSI